MVSIMPPANSSLEQAPSRLEFLESLESLESNSNSMEPTCSPYKKASIHMEEYTCPLKPVPCQQMSAPSFKEPAPSSLSPAPSSLEPTSSSLEPTASSLDPAASSLEPTTSSLEPTATSLQRAASLLEPNAGSLEPTASSLEPPASSLEPTASSLEPTASSLEPSAFSLPSSDWVSEVASQLTEGPGYVVIPGLYSQAQVVTAREELLAAWRRGAKPGVKEYKEGADINQNNYSGLTYGLLHLHPVFRSMAIHPVIRQVSAQLLGSNCRLSSLSGNSLVSGMPGQAPHLDYPHHRPLWAASGPTSLAKAPSPFSLTFITPLTPFTPESGATSLVPGSQKLPTWPQQEEHFNKQVKQVTASPGDLIIMAGSVQHCAGRNTTSTPRCALLQQMVPLYVVPFEELRPAEEAVMAEASDEEREVWQQFLALSHPLPKLMSKPMESPAAG